MLTNVNLVEGDIVTEISTGLRKGEPPSDPMPPRCSGVISVALSRRLPRPALGQPLIAVEPGLSANS
jgi:hypothetical protein